MMKSKAAVSVLGMFLAAVILSSRVSAGPVNLDPVRTDGSVFLDSSGRQVILRGFITLTHNFDASEVNYTPADYQRMKSLGANYQCVRVFAGAIGAWPGRMGPAWYFERLDGMLQKAKQAGMYTVFKLTLYDLKGLDWGEVWLNRHGEQEAIIQGWKKLWEKYKNDPSVIGYDLLNEPEKGKLSQSDEEFVNGFLNPFYQKLIDALQKTDDQKPAFIQPGFHLLPLPYYYLPYSVPVNRKNVVYAPHYYPPITSYAGTSPYYEQTMEKYSQEAKLHQAPLFIGEFGMVWNPKRDGDKLFETGYQKTEKAALTLIDQAKLGFSRPWYANDRAAFSPDYNWALIKGTSSLENPRDFILDVLVRPYPQRTAGTLTEFGYSVESKKFKMNYIPKKDSETWIFVPQARHYNSTFTFNHGSGLKMVFDLSSASLKVVSNPENVDVRRISWDESNQLLKIREWEEKSTTVQIEP